MNLSPFHVGICPPPPPGFTSNLDNPIIPFNLPILWYTFCLSYRELGLAFLPADTYSVYYPGPQLSSKATVGNFRICIDEDQLRLASDHYLVYWTITNG
jgi:hypothetical protein